MRRYGDMHTRVGEPNELAGSGTLDAEGRRGARCAQQKVRAWPTKRLLDSGGVGTDRRDVYLDGGAHGAAHVH